jgi:dCMP deaminase
MKEKYVNLYMDFAERVAQLSYAQRKKVGAAIVNDDTVVYGYNGMPAGWDNECEDKVYMSAGAGGWLSPDEIYEQWPFEDEHGRYKLVTKPEVLHAESNAIGKLARSVVNGKGADLFVTLSPCIECAKLIHQTGIKRVFYRDQYRNDAGIKFLQQCNIEVNQI